MVPVGGEVVEGGLNVDGLPQHKDVDHDSERVELVFLPDLIVLAELAAVAVEHVAREAVPGLTAVEQVVNARRWYPDFTHTDPPGSGRIAWHGWFRSYVGSASVSGAVMSGRQASPSLLHLARPADSSPSRARVAVAMGIPVAFAAPVAVM